MEEVLNIRWVSLHDSMCANAPKIHTGLTKPDGSHNMLMEALVRQSISINFCSKENFKLNRNLLEGFGITLNAL